MECPGGLVPGELDADGQERWVECTYCRTLNGPGAEHCYACGRVLPADDGWDRPEPTDRPGGAPAGSSYGPAGGAASGRRRQAGGGRPGGAAPGDAGGDWGDPGGYGQGGWSGAPGGYDRPGG